MSQMFHQSHFLYVSERSSRMDLRMCREMKKKNTEEAPRKMMKTCVKRPDLMVNEAIVKFCSTSSSDALEQQDQRAEPSR